MGLWRQGCFRGPLHALRAHSRNGSNAGQRAATRAVRASAQAVPVMKDTLCVLNEDGRVRQTDQPASKWLTQSPRGAYTTARSVGLTKVFDLSFHISRLAETARLMASDMATPPPAALTDPELLRPLAISSARAAVDEFRTAHASEGSCELKLTFLTHWEAGRPSVSTHVAMLPPIPRPPIKVQLRGHPRSNAAAKDSEWVRERAALEEDKPADVNEIVLLDDEARALEGMSSNFAVVSNGTVFTAGDGVLLGTVRDIMLQVCGREGIPVVQEAPSIQNINAWEGCMVMSTSRLCLPVDSVILSAEPADAAHLELAGADRTPRVFDFQRGTLVDRIRDLVSGAIDGASEPLE